ncbi:MAG: hypothetical protein GWM98_18030, partial [Nitrospinaceae bacterium]|nr:hypothetical protein [Nitrospinaceae bacterium]NIR56045.1 hypothetical protein [Nitrospinaceae bacterium]NIS86489.1 hypothetical protein [Nitrospinaceae bacterium]NIT83324.1 hypothetical protein [Nitrospinaceae bacterium]NIU45534.1 hypothetical protein [Nitrospinaceae bacterium]
MAPNPNRLFSQSLLPVVLLCGWLGGGFVPPLAAETGEPVEVQRVRLGPHPEYTRILVDLNRSTDYRLQPDFEHKTLTLILPNARPGPRLRSKTYHDKNLERIGVEARGQAVHIRFQLTQSNTRFFHSMSSDRAQIILDLKGETKPYLGAQIGQPAPPPESRAGDSGDREAVPQRARSRPPASSPPVRILGMTPESVRELNRKAIESKLEHGWEDYQ